MYKLGPGKKQKRLCVATYLHAGTEHFQRIFMLMRSFLIGSASSVTEVVQESNSYDLCSRLQSHTFGEVRVSDSTKIRQTLTVRRFKFEVLMSNPDTKLLCSCVGWLV